MRSGRKIAVGCLISVIAFAGLATAGGFWMYSEVKQAGIHQREFEAVTVGMSRDEVGKRVGVGAGGTVRKGLQSEEPPRKGSDCIYGVALLDKPPIGRSYAYRFCFTGNRLVEKMAFALRSH
ncbi:hypothetical protein [Streptomyces sp. DB-54]